MRLLFVELETHPGSRGPDNRGDVRHPVRMPMRDLTVFTFVAVLLLTACGDGLGPMPDAPPLLGPAFLAAEVDGQAWNPGTAPGQLSLFFGTHRLAITADRPLADPSTVERLALELETPVPPQPGTYVLNNGPAAFATITTYTLGQITAFFTTTAQRTGALMIAEVSPTDSLMSGAFRFEAVTLDGRTVRHVRGTFRLHFP